MITALILLGAVGVLGWGFYRARPFGKLGMLAWLQSVVLMVPWLIFFGLVAAGIAINLVGILFLLVASIGVYIFLGRQLRVASQEEAGFDQVSAWRREPEKPPDQASADLPASDQGPAPDPSADTEAETLATPIPEADLKAVQGIFGVDTFFSTETIPYQEGAIFKGNLRGDPKAIYRQLSERLQANLPDQYRLFLVENQEAKPVVIVLPRKNDPKPATLVQKIVAGVLMLATGATCLETGSLLQGFDLFAAPDRIAETIPIGLGILSILAVHEIGHQVLARRHQVRLSVPFLIPAWQIGSFGGLTRFESLIPNRTVLFDVALAGPAAGGIFSLILLLLGLTLSNPSSLFQIPAPFFQGSLLVGSLARVVLGDALQETLVSVHPLVVIGWLGLVITALNLMPAGQLDGGRTVQAIYGRKVAKRTTIATLIILALVSLANPLALYWAVFILFLQRDLERPSLEELSEPNDARAALALLALFLMVATLVPLAPGLAGRLGIGG